MLVVRGENGATRSAQSGATAARRWETSAIRGSRENANAADTYSVFPRPAAARPAAAVRYRWPPRARRYCRPDGESSRVTTSACRGDAGECEALRSVSWPSGELSQARLVARHCLSAHRNSPTLANHHHVRSHSTVPVSTQPPKCPCVTEVVLPSACSLESVLLR